MALLTEGDIIRGTYEVERFLGEGAFAEVYRVKHRYLGRQALKVFKNQALTQEDTEAVLAEALLLSRMGHPHIVRVFDANVAETSEGRRGFFTMEYVAGGTLEQFWQSFGPDLVPVETAVDVVRQVCRGLACAHTESPPIVHRDVKPQNILIGYDATGVRARLSDFGLAKRAGPLSGLVSARGTPAFKAPEVLHGTRRDSCASDVWALGATLYLLLTDRLPYPALDVVDAARFDRPLVPPSRLNLRVEPTLESVVLRALTLDPAARYADANAFLEELGRWTPRSGGVKAGTGQSTKNVLGVPPPRDRDEGRRLADEALALSQRANRLTEAADLMEEAFNRWPGLRERYAYRLQLWRRGITR